MTFMKSITLSLVGLMCTGCHQFWRAGSEDVVFDTDPFTQIDHSRTAAAPQNAASAPGALQAPPPTAVPGSQEFMPFEGAAAQGHPDAAAFAGPPASGPAARAAADAAAFAAQQQQYYGGQQHIHQAGLEDFQPELTTPADPFAESGAVVNTVYKEITDDPGRAQFDLSPEMLDLPPRPLDRTLPGTDLPVQPGRATLSTPADSDWDPIPTPASDIDTQPVFSPPTNSSASDFDAVRPAPEPARRAIIHDSTNSSKWRAVRRS